MPDRSPNTQTREGQSDNSVPIGLPLAALIAVLFLFGSTFFWPAEIRGGRTAAKYGATHALLGLGHSPWGVATVGVLHPKASPFQWLEL